MLKKTQPKKLLKRANPPPEPKGKSLKKKVALPAGAIKDPSPSFHGCMLVPIEKAPDSYPKVDPKRNFAGITYFRVDPKDGRILCMVTREFDTSHAWGGCGRCFEWFLHCRCKSGIVTGRGVEYCIDQQRALEAGEEWGMNHPNYEGSLTKAARKSNERNPVSLIDKHLNIIRNAGNTPSMRGKGKKPVQNFDTAPTGKRLSKTTKPLGKPLGKSLNRKAGPEVEISEDMNITDFDAHASSTADDLTKRMLSKAGSAKPAPKKLLRKKVK